MRIVGFDKFTEYTLRAIAKVVHFVFIACVIDTVRVICGYIFFVYPIFFFSQGSSVANREDMKKASSCFINKIK